MRHNGNKQSGKPGRNKIRRFFSRPSRGRRESNRWLLRQCSEVQGDVLSIGSESDSDRQGDFYRNYFSIASSYTTSEVSPKFGCDLICDIRSMPQIADNRYDCIFCNGVLEHVDDIRAGLAEMTRILKSGGILLLGVPFRQAIHMGPNDFWRFTEFGIRYLLKDAYEIIDLVGVEGKKRGTFPAAYWVKARKRQQK
jgi:SAM-dependent methyltransferase